MNKAEALKILIEQSKFIPEQGKKTLLEKLPELNEDEQDKLGNFLALTLQHAIEDNQELNAELEQVITNLEKQEKE